MPNKTFHAAKMVICFAGVAGIEEQICLEGSMTLADSLHVLINGDSLGTKRFKTSQQRKTVPELFMSFHILIAEPISMSFNRQADCELFVN
jgi:hypothetical protein